MRVAGALPPTLPPHGTMALGGITILPRLGHRTIMAGGPLQLWPLRGSRRRLPLPRKGHGYSDQDQESSGNRVASCAIQAPTTTTKGRSMRRATGICSRAHGRLPQAMRLVTSPMRKIWDISSMFPPAWLGSWSPMTSMRSTWPWASWRGRIQQGGCNPYSCTVACSAVRMWC